MAIQKSHLEQIVGKRNVLDDEETLNNYATKFKGSLACLDTAIWIVMRSCWKEAIL